MTRIASRSSRRPVEPTIVLLPPPVSQEALQAAATRIRARLLNAAASNLDMDEEMKRVVAARDAVVPRYQAILSPARLKSLTPDEFRSFLSFKNNQHWIGLSRLGPYITEDMPRLRRALQVLFDEDRPLVERLDHLVPAKGAAYVPRLNRAVLTPLLLVAYPSKYGVWNQISEAGLRELHIWPVMDRSQSFGEKYALVNSVLLHLAKLVEVDLWTLDSLLWHVQQEEDVDPDPDPLPPGRFGLERHLHEFLYENWTGTDLGREWSLHEESGEEVGYEYSCEVGRIDLLARHRTRREWLVVELKRNQSSDVTVGQVLRYMGWVRRKLAKPGEKVRGMIIAHQADASLRYALESVSDVSLKLYEVEFKLREPDAMSM